MNKTIKILILMFSVPIIVSFIWLLSEYSGFDYAKKVEISFSFAGAMVGGIATLVALYITVMQTRDMQKDDRDKQIKQDKRSFSNEVEILISKYISDISAYFYAQTLRDSRNPPTIDRRESVQIFELLKIKLRNIRYAEELINKLFTLQSSSSIFNRGDSRDKAVEIFQKDIDDLSKLAIEFSEKYNEV